LGTTITSIWYLFFQINHSEPDFYPESHLHQVGRDLETRLHILLITLISITSWLIAQGVDFPSTPSQAPIGGLGLLGAVGGAMAWKKLKNRKK